MHTHIYKYLFAFLLLASTAFTARAADYWNCIQPSKYTYSGGSGTQDDPYLISSAEDLAIISYWSDRYGTNVYYRQTCDITLNDDVITAEGTFNSANKKNFKAWEPIAHVNMSGETEYCFAGHYDGNGYTIRGLYSAIHDLCYGQGGLFHSVKGPSVTSTSRTAMWKPIRLMA